MKALVLDGMGVLYAVADDVQDLLYPFIVEKGGTRDSGFIQELYVAASLGKIPSSDFWRSVGLKSNVEDEYLQRHSLTEGALEFLNTVTQKQVELWGLSNDISEWSLKLREKFGLKGYFTDFIVSGDVGFRKPGLEIYQILLERASLPAGEIVFVDDNPRNLYAAASLGIRPILFDSDKTTSRITDIKTIRSFPELLRILIINGDISDGSGITS